MREFEVYRNGTHHTSVFAETKREARNNYASAMGTNNFELYEVKEKKPYKEKNQPTNDMFVYIYAIANRLNDLNLYKEDYTRKKAKELMKYTLVPEFSYRIIDKYSNHIIKELN